MKALAKRLITGTLSALLLTGTSAVARHTEIPFRIQDAEYNEETELLIVVGKGQHRCVVEIFYPGGEFIGSTIVPDKRWRFTIRDLEPVPCAVEAVQVETQDCDYGYDTMQVDDAPDDCGVP